jgi:D-alanyl-D-alanine-carboxypeptidase/D-alanyl-D-alanine-endopeptidase
MSWSARALRRALVVAVAVLATAQTSPLQQRLKERVDAGKNKGIVAATIASDGHVTYSAYGVSGGASPLGPDSVFEIGSITKVFTGTLLVEMADRGEVALADPVAKYLPDGVRMPSRNGRAITLLDLATHSSGLPRLMNNLLPVDARNPYATYSERNLYDFLSNHELRRDIGAQYEYSNVGVGRLGHALARRAGKSYEVLVTERILKPLGLTNTAITLSDRMTAHLALGHDPAGAVVPNWDLPTLAGAGALRSTARDMVTFLKANLDPNAGRLHTLMQTTHESRVKTQNANVDVGIAWHIRRSAAQTITWHNGGTGGYRSFIGFDKAHRTGAVVLTNSARSADDLAIDLLTREQP